MINEKIISESQNLYSDIDYCITELLKARTEHNSENEDKALFKMESLMVSTLQHLAYIIEQPSLPSNLDEAAEKWKEEHFKREYYQTPKDAMSRSFKAGAEWMAERGVSVEGVFKAGDPGYPDVRMGEQYSIENILLKPDGIEPGDEVIVRIRKK